MKPLKSEINGIAAILKDGADTPEELAERVISKVDEVRAERVTYSVVLRFGGPKTPFFQGFGPFSTKNQALKALEKHPAADQAKGMAVVPMLNDNGYDLLLASVDAPVKTRGDWVTVRTDAEAHARGEKPKP